VTGVSNTLAIAVVTSTIRYLLDDSIAGSGATGVDGAQVTTVHPRLLHHELGSDDRLSGLNVHLYDVTWDPTRSLPGIPFTDNPRPGDQQSGLAINLHYLVTAYGKDTVLEPQRLLAIAARTLASSPVLARPVLAAAIAKYGHDDMAFLANSDLAEQPEPVRLTPEPVSIEDSSRLWSALSAPHLPSLAYVASVVLL
jgi:hypothetical protein